MCLHWQLFSTGFETELCLPKWRSLGIENNVFYLYNTHLDLKEYTASCLEEAEFAEDSSASTRHTDCARRADRKPEEGVGQRGRSMSPGCSRAPEGQGSSKNGSWHKKQKFCPVKVVIPNSISLFFLDGKFLLIATSVLFLVGNKIANS